MEDSELVDDIASQVKNHTLPEELADLADRYETEVGIRDRFVWKWFHLLNPHFSLSCVEPQYESKVRNDKTLLTFYITLIDDLLEARDDEATFEEAVKFPFEAQTADFDNPDIDESYLKLTRDTWERVQEAIAKAPFFEDVDEIFTYDLRQVINAIRYTSVVSQHFRMANLTEAYAYGSHNMVMFPYANIDLMHAPGFDWAEMGDLRRLLWRAQQMARIGNWVSTWERELEENDYGSGVVILAVENGIVSPAEVLELGQDSGQTSAQAVIDKIREADIEDALVNEWFTRYDSAQAMDLNSIDVDDFLEGMETVMQFHLTSRGLK